MEVLEIRQLRHREAEADLTLPGVVPLLVTDPAVLAASRAGPLVLGGDVPGAVHPAVGVQHVPLDTVRPRPGITLYRVSEELSGRDEDAGEDEDAGGDLVEQFEAPVVDADLLQLQEAADGFTEGPEQLRHDCLVSAQLRPQVWNWIERFEFLPDCPVHDIWGGRQGGS